MCEGPICRVIPYFNGKAVGIRIRRQEYFRIHLQTEFLRQRKSLRVFGVGVTDGREVRVRVLLLLHNVDIGKAPFFNDSHERNGAGSIQGGVNNRNRKVKVRWGRVDSQRLNRIEIGSVFDLAAHGNEAGLLRFFKRRRRCSREVGQGINLRCNPLRHFPGNLAAVGPIDLVAVVVLRIVGSREVETGHRVLGPNQIGELRRGPNAVEGIDPDAVVCKDGCGQFSKFPAHMAGVEGDAYSFFG